MVYKPDLTLWTFKFVVRATNRSDAAKILKDTLGIEAAHDASDRKINGLYLTSCFVNEDKLTERFYKNIEKSPDIAIHSDEKSADLYPKILAETRIVEEKIRWLLLHVSDAIEDYAKFVKAKDGAIIGNKSMDPATSRLSFESMIAILEIDLSWAGQGVNTEKVSQVINSTTDYESLKKKLLDETIPKTIWNSISGLVLEKPVDWDALKTKLMIVKKLRNDCAHFHTVTDKDLSQAKHVRKRLATVLTKEKTITRSYASSLRSLNEQLAQTLKIISQDYISNIDTSALTALSSQIDTMNLSQNMQKIVQQSIPTDAFLRATQNMMPRLNITNLSQSLIDSINCSISSMHGFYGIAGDEEEVDEGGEVTKSPDPEKIDDDKESSGSDNEEKKK